MLTTSKKPRVETQNTPATTRAPKAPHTFLEHLIVDNANRPGSRLGEAIDHLTPEK